MFLLELALTLMSGAWWRPQFLAPPIREVEKQALAVRLTVIPVSPIPSPAIQDEFGRLLIAGTFLNGRVTDRSASRQFRESRPVALFVH